MRIELPGEITFECLKSIPGRDPKVIDHARLVKQAQFSQGDSLNIGRQLAASDARPNQLRFAVRKALDHPETIIELVL